MSSKLRRVSLQTGILFCFFLCVVAFYCEFVNDNSFTLGVQGVFADMFALNEVYFLLHTSGFIWQIITVKSI
jgi:hypothetical protein